MAAARTAPHSSTGTQRCRTSDRTAAAPRCPERRHPGPNADMGPVSRRGPAPAARPGRHSRMRMLKARTPRSPCRKMPKLSIRAPFSQPRSPGPAAGPQPPCRRGARCGAQAAAPPQEGTQGGHGRRSAPVTGGQSPHGRPEKTSRETGKGWGRESPRQSPPPPARPPVPRTGALPRCSLCLPGQPGGHNNCRGPGA